jgi:hypothetical protein
VTAALSVLSPTPAVLEGLPLAIDRDEVLRFQGYQKGVDVPAPPVLAIFEEALALGRSLIAPRVVYRTVAVTGGAADRIDAGGERLHIPQIARLWGPIEAVGAGICTVGEALEAHVRRLFDAREFPLAVMLDSVGSAAVESLAEYARSPTGSAPATRAGTPPSRRPCSGCARAAPSACSSTTRAS